MNTFRRHIKVLQYLFDCWSQDTDVVVCAALDDSDIDMPAGDSVTDDIHTFIIEWQHKHAGFKNKT